MDFSYPSEKFSTARRNLMLPSPSHEAEDIAMAFHECHLGLLDVRPEDLDDNARHWVTVLKGLMNTTDIEDPTGRGKWPIKAERLSADDKIQLVRVMDELAHWFARRSR